MPQIDVSSFANQIFIFFLVFFLLLNFISQTVMLNLALVFRMRKYNPLKFVQWRKALWLSVLNFFNNSANRCWFVFYSYYQEFVKINYYSSFWLQTVFISQNFLAIRELLVVCSLSVFKQTYDLQNLFETEWL